MTPDNTRPEAEGGGSSRPDPLAGRLAETLVRAIRLVGRTSSRSKTGPLSSARYELLHALFHHGPESMGRTAGRLGVAPRTVTGLVDALEAEGLLRRMPHPRDRRTHLLEITPAGLKLVKAVRKVRLAGVARLFDPLDAGERATLSRLLEKIILANEGSPDRGC